MRRIVLALAAAVLCGTAAGAQVRDLPTRPHATVRTLTLVPAAAPRLAAVLLVGGTGVANIPARAGAEWERNGSFLVRSRALFRDRGIYTVLMDAPSDHRFGLGTWRFSPEHAQDIGDVVAEIRRHVAGVKVWLVATSAGTASAANAAIQLSGAGAPDGLVLTSAVARTLPTMNLGRIRVPVLLVQHRDDACTPLWAAEPLPAMFTNSPRVEMQLFSGGGGPRPDACEITAPHSFYGLDGEVVDAIVTWMGGS
jgi:pimeloyl-ACP methyl ester carboxylesterase